tara:strand:- start:19736 stop:20029 length:294 start_codon:yes stop_codon:yes gene_type:complete
VIEENEFVCNKCTRDMRVPLELINSNAERKQLRPYGYPHGFVYGLVAEFLTGYFTYSREGYETHLKDGEIVNFKLCEPCLSDLFKTFEIPPEKEMYL